MTERKGQCMCGAVRFVARNAPDTYGVCHCEMCRRWAGSALFGITVPAAGLDWSGAEHIRVLQSSDWAERAWCDRCGSGLYYHVTLAGEMSQSYEIPIGLLDDTEGMRLNNEIFFDHRLPGLDLKGDHTRRTRAETLVHFGISDDTVTE